MGYLEELTIGSFRKDAEGRNVFYPYGIMGKGYILPDAERVPRMRSSMHGLYLMILGCGIPFILLYGVVAMPRAYLIGAVAIAVIGAHLFVRNLVRGLPYSPERITLQEVRRNVARGDSAALLVLMAIASGICLLISIVVVAPRKGSIGLAGAAFFGMSFGTYMRKARLKRQG